MKALLLLVSATTLVASNNPTSLKDFAARPSAPAHNQVSAYLSDLQTAVIDARRQAGQLSNMAKSPLLFDWNSHAVSIAQVREDINRAARIHTRLNMLRSEALPWQQFAIDRAGEALARLARATDASIRSLERDKRVIANAEYRRDALAVYQRAEELVALIERKLELHDLAKRSTQIASEISNSLD